MNFDTNLSFLNVFVESSILKGSKLYDKEKSMKVSMGQSST